MSYHSDEVVRLFDLIINGIEQRKEKIQARFLQSRHPDLADGGYVKACIEINTWLARAREEAINAAKT